MSTLRACQDRVFSESVQPHTIVPHDLALCVGADAGQTEEGFKATGELPIGWDPDLNDGMRVNIAPMQRLGLLAADVLLTRDLKSLLAPEGRS